MSQMADLTHTMKDITKRYGWSKEEFVHWFGIILRDIGWDLTYETVEFDYKIFSEYLEAKDKEQYKLLEEIWEAP